MKRLVYVCAAWCAAWPVVAEAPGDSLRPQARPLLEALAPVEATSNAVEPSTTQIVAPATDLEEKTTTVQSVADQDAGPVPAVRPVPRGGTFATSETPADSMIQVSRQVTRIHYGAETRPSVRPRHPLADYTVTLAAVAVSAYPGAPLPKARPAGFKDLFKRRQKDASGSYSPKGSVCGVNAIKGAPQKTFGNPGGGCGISNPVRVIEVAGVRLSTPAQIDCTTAKALNTWVEKSMKPAFGRRGGGLSQIKIAASYSCRNRNNKSGGRLSEHAKGHAVDVSGFVLKDGTQISVLKGWRSKADSKAVRKIHRDACGPFGTVLGPNADRYHQDHFHVDTARYRSGTYCK